MSPRSKKTSELMRAKTRKSIIAASLELFAKHGFSATTTEEIARKAGISKGLIFTHFNKKQDILLAIFEGQIDRILPGFLMENDRRPAREKLVSLVTAWLHMIKTEPLLIRLSLQLNLDDAYRRLIRSKKWRQYFETLMAQMKTIMRDLGSDNPEYDSILLMFVFDGIVANYTVAPEMFPPLDAVANHLVHVLTSRWEKVRG